LASVKNVQAADYKALVVVFLSGGYDGNNVLVPLDGAYNDYAKARPSLALPKDSFVSLSGTHIGHKFGLSPANRAFADLFEQKRVAVIANAGALVQPTTMAQYKSNSVKLPPFLGSHAEQEQWIQGWMGEEDTSGWGGRAMDAMASDMKNFQPLVAMARDYTAVVGRSTSLSLANSGSGARWGMADLADPTSIARQRIEWASRLQSGNVYENEFCRSLRSAYSDTVLFAQGQSYGSAPVGEFADVQVGRDLRYLARNLAYAKQSGARRQIYLVQDCGYDTPTCHLSTSTNNPGLEHRNGDFTHRFVGYE